MDSDERGSRQPLMAQYGLNDYQRPITQSHLARTHELHGVSLPVFTFTSLYRDKREKAVQDDFVRTSILFVPLPLCRSWMRTQAAILDSTYVLFSRTAPKHASLLSPLFRFLRFPPAVVRCAGVVDEAKKAVMFRIVVSRMIRRKCKASS